MSSTSPGLSKTEITRLRWRCRRGMLELDLFLEPFVNEVYAQLTSEEQSAFKRLLDATDPELYAWFTGQAVPEEAALINIVERIAAHAKRAS